MRRALLLFAGFVLSTPLSSAPRLEIDPNGGWVLALYVPPSFALPFGMDPKTGWEFQKDKATIAIRGLGLKAPHYCSGKIASRDLHYFFPLNDPAGLGGRRTRLTLGWTAIKTGWAAAGIRIQANGRTVIDMRRQTLGSATGRLTSVEVSASSVRKRQGLAVCITVAAQCGGSGSAAWVSADQLQLELVQ
jgi:hypothetical protein